MQDVAEGAMVASIPLRLAITDTIDSDDPADVRIARRLVEEAEKGKASPWFPFIQVQTPRPRFPTTYTYTQTSLTL